MTKRWTRRRGVTLHSFSLNKNSAPVRQSLFTFLLFVLLSRLRGTKISLEWKTRHIKYVRCVWKVVQTKIRVIFAAADILAHWTVYLTQESTVTRALFSGLFFQLVFNSCCAPWLHSLFIVVNEGFHSNISFGWWLIHFLRPLNQLVHFY